MEFARPHYEGKDPAHGWNHIRRILARLPWLTTGLPPTRRCLLYFLAVFHGLAGSLRGDRQFRAETVSFLESIGWNSSEITDAFDALDRHLDRPEGVEEMVIHDANAIEAVGAFGIAKAFTKGGADGQQFEETIRLYRGFLAGVTFHTPAGRAVEVERRAYAEDFLARFAVEDEIPSGTVQRH